MTPFGEAIRRLRAERGISQKRMAADLGVSAAYLSALEHGNRSAPSFDFLQRVAGYFNIIWDEADSLFRTARLSDPRTTIDTAGLHAEATEFANRLSEEIRELDLEAIRAMRSILEKSAKKRG